MNLSKIYYDANGGECNILQLVEQQPEWAANRIQEGEKAIKDFEAYKQYSQIRAEAALENSKKGMEELTSQIKELEGDPDCQ